MSGSPSATGSTSRHSWARVACSAFSIPWISCSSSSSTRGLCLVLRADVPANWSPDSVTVPPGRSGPAPPGHGSVLVQRAGLVHRGAAALLAAHLVLGLVLAGPDGPARCLRVGGDRPFDGALGGASV